jgi:hypothetical protein
MDYLALFAQGLLSGFSVLFYNSMECFGLNPEIRENRNYNDNGLA